MRGQCPTCGSPTGYADSVDFVGEFCPFRSCGWREPALRELSPGASLDQAGDLHFDLAAMLRDRGYADTPENQELLAREIRKVWPDVPVVEDDPA